jgi:CHAD domain-containing protein
MSFVLVPHEGAGDGLKRVIREQAEKLAAECGEAQEHSSAFAHKARVRCKRIRAALRLARPLMTEKTFARENRWWRDLGRLLSDLRDASARVEALESLRPFLVTRIGPEATRRLEERFQAERRETDATDVITAFIAQLEARDGDLVPDLDDGSRDRLVVALGETYRMARNSMKTALEAGEAELLHEWRKQAKYHALQVRLMRQQFPDALDRRVAGVRDLAELLGEVQDIEIVTEASRGWKQRPAGFFDVLKTRRAALVTGARATGAALFAEKPKDWCSALTPPVMAGQD